MKKTETVETKHGLLTIYETETRRDLRTFIRFPDSLYRKSPSYCPALMADEEENLRRDKNPAFEYCDARYFMAYRAGKPVGRIAALHNRRFNETWHKNCMRFTRYDVIDDLEVSRALLNAVEKYAKECGLSEIQGPMGFSDLDHQGLLVEGFEERGMFITSYNHPYYKEHLESLGFTKQVDWVEYEIKVPSQTDEKLRKIADYVLAKNDLHIVPIRKMKDVRPYIQGIFNLLFDAYQKLYGVIPLTEKQAQLYAEQFITVVKPDFITVIADKDNKPVSFGVVMPSMLSAVRKAHGRLFPFGWFYLLRYFLSKKSDVLEFMLLGSSQAYMGRGLNACTMLQIHESAIRYHVKYGETGPMLEDNLRIQATWKNYEYRQHKRRRCYVKKTEE